MKDHCVVFLVILCSGVNWNIVESFVLCVLTPQLRRCERPQRSTHMFASFQCLSRPCHCRHNHKLSSRLLCVHTVPFLPVAIPFLATPAKQHRGQDDCDTFTHTGIYIDVLDNLNCVCIMKPPEAWWVPRHRVGCMDVMSVGQLQHSHSAHQVFSLLQSSEQLRVSALQFQSCFVMDHRNYHVNASMSTAKAAR